MKTTDKIICAIVGAAILIFATAMFYSTTHRSVPNTRTSEVPHDNDATPLPKKRTPPPPEVNLPPPVVVAATPPPQPVLVASATPSGVPASLQGIWSVTKPNDPQFASEPPRGIHFTAVDFFERMRQEPGVEVIWDDTGSRMTLITGLDGNKYFEGTHYSVIVNTATMPWQIDLSAKSTGGEAIAKKGIYELQEDTLRLSIGKAGNERPKTFDRQPLGSSDYIVMEATRVKSNK